MAQVGGLESNGLLQGSRDDGGRLEGGRGGREGGDLRLDRQHGRFCRGLCGARGNPCSRADPGGSRRRPEGRPDTDVRRQGARGARRLRRGARIRAGARRARHPRARQFRQSASPGRPEDRGVRDRRGARRRSGRLRDPLRRRRQHLGVRNRDRRARPRDADLFGRGRATARRRSPPRSGSATPSTQTVFAPPGRRS